MVLDVWKTQLRKNMGMLKNDALKKRFEDREIPAVLEKMPENLRHLLRAIRKSQNYMMQAYKECR